MILNPITNLNVELGVGHIYRKHNLFEPGVAKNGTFQQKKLY